MESRTLGRTDLRIAPLVLGGNVFGWTADEATSFRILDAAVDHGLNAIDMADVYSAWVEGHEGGESGTVIGKWLAARGGYVRDRVALRAGPATRYCSPSTTSTPGWATRTDSRRWPRSRGSA